MRVGIVGLGLIGGSLALALRDSHDVRGYDLSPDATVDGVRRVARLEDLVPADVVLIATPARVVVATLERLAQVAGGAVLLDTASLKREVAAWAETAPASARVVGGHPMAGSTASGSAAADAALLRGQPFLLVPTARSDAAAMEVAGDLARAVGAVPTVCSAEAHDRAVAMLSGVPLAVALALARAGGDVAHLAGPGFAGATRLAATPMPLAHTILRSNAANVRDALARFREALDEVERELGD